jgi:hypothetical protein
MGVFIPQLAGNFSALRVITASSVGGGVILGTPSPELPSSKLEIEGPVAQNSEFDEIPQEESQACRGGGGHARRLQEVQGDAFPGAAGTWIALVNKVDTETSSPVDFEFINELKLGEGVPKSDPEFASGCSCPESGCDLKHGCSDRDEYEATDKKFAYAKHGGIFSNRDNRLAIFECNPRSKCGRKAVSIRLRDPVAHFIEGCMTGATGGWGLFRGVFIPQLADNFSAFRVITASSVGGGVFLGIPSLGQHPQSWGNEGPVAQNSELCARVGRRGGPVFFWMAGLDT